jgi:hypothetical protein
MLTPASPQLFASDFAIRRTAYLSERRAYYTEAALDAYADEKMSAPRRSTSDAL